MLRRALWVFLLIYLGSTAAFARSYIEWAKPEINLPDLEVNDLRFTNRARCALDSKVPTDSAFVMVQNMDAARGLYRLAKQTNSDPGELTKMGVKVYRYAVVNLLQFIHRNLMEGNLPLLPVDTQAKGVPQKYREISEQCKSDAYCEELDQYVGNIWETSTSKKSSGIKASLLNRIDNFNFIKSESSQLSCHYLKKFSPLQANLYGVKPTAEVFEELAKVNINRDEYIGDCYDIEEQKDLKVALFQMDLQSLNQRNFEKFGFDYWNSLKLYFSWAWRYAPQMVEMAAPFDEVFRGIPLEESVIIIPTGCKSITPPKCDGDYLQLNALREFAKKDYKKEVIDTDVMDPLPEGPQKDLLDNEFPEVNVDIMDLAEHENAEAWLEGFRDNLERGREVMKRKLINSVNFLNIVTANMPVEEILANIEARFSKSGFGANNSEVSSQDKELQDELYYLCGEFTQAAHKEFSFLKGDLEILKKTTLIDHLSNQIIQQNTEKFFDYYTRMADLVTKSCNNMNQKAVWDDKYDLDKTGFSDWYLEKIYEGKVKSTAGEKFNKYLSSHKPLISYKGFDENKSFENVVCINGTHCARKTLAAIIDLYAVAQYANTFWSMDQKIKTPAFFNPYAERTSCKVYDPWFKTKQTVFSMFTSLGQAAMSAFVPGAVFAGLDLKPGRVVSFKQLVSEGKIKYDVKRKRATIFDGLIADFGPLLGVPCKVSISKWFESDPYQAFTFAGISVGTCYNKSTSSLTVRTASDMDSPVENTLNTCVSCTLNFETVTNSLTAISTIVPYAGPGLFLLKGMVQLYKNLHDPHNIPRDFKSNPNYVLDTYRRFGEIPKKCARQLRNGKPCLASNREERIADAIRKNIKAPILGFVPDLGTAQVKVRGCDKYLEVKFGRVDQVIIPPSCSFLALNSPKISVEDEFKTEGEKIETKAPEREIITREERPRGIIERARLRRGSSLKMDEDLIEISAGKLFYNDCSISFKNVNAYLRLFNFKLKGIKEVGLSNANWFIFNPGGKDIPLYLNNPEQEEISFDNLEISLVKNFDKALYIYNQSTNQELPVSIGKCSGFKDYKSRYKK